jgi:hypothetical protein
MLKPDAYGKDFRDLEGLVGACNENGSLVPGHEPLKAEVATLLEQTRVLKIQQESLQGNSRAATDRFRDSLEATKEKAVKLRSFIISVLGPTNPLLSLFGIPPKKVPNPNNRRRSKRKAKPETPAPTPANPQTPEGQTAKPSDPAKPAA